MRHKSVSYAKWGYIFCIPFTLAFLVFSLYPTLYTMVIGFTDLQGFGKSDFKFLENPFANYEIILNNQQFLTSLGNTFKLWIVNFIPQILLALILAAWFTSRQYKVKGQGLFKVLFYMPNIITAASIAILFYSLFMFPMGPVNYILQTFGLIKEPINFYVNGGASQNVVSFIQFWMWYGYTMLVLISGVMGLSPSLFESAEIDGASSFKSFIFITLPNLRTILLYTLVTSLIGGLQMFDIPQQFLNGQPGNATLTASLFIRNQAFSGAYLYNRASAASMIMFLIICVFSAVIFILLRDKDASKLRKIERAQIKAYRSKTVLQKEAGK